MPKLIKSLFLILFFVTPFIFSPYNSESFEIPKMYFVYLMTILIIFFHSLNYFRKQTSLFIRHPLNIPLLIFLSSQIIAIIFSIDKYTSFFGYYSRLNGGLLSLLAFSILFFILPNYLDSKFIKKIISFTLTSGTIIAIYGILQHFGIDKSYWPNDDVMARVFSTLGQPNWLAAYLCILIPLVFYLPSSVIRALLSVIFFICLFFTKSKSGLIAATISLLIYFILKYKISKKIIILISVICALCSVIIFKPTPVNTKLNVTSSADIRKIVWGGAINVAKLYPFFGTGPETFAFSYYWVRPALHNTTSEWEFLYNKVHNEYLNYLANTGIIGLTTYLFFIYSCTKFIYKNKQFELLSAFISILITSFAGFNVVITSLFLFLIPLLSKPKPESISPAYNFRRLILISSTIFCLISAPKIINFYFADIALASANRLDSQNIYPQAYQVIVKAYHLHPNNPTILSRASVIFAKTKQVDNALTASSKALNISPYDVNLWKERTQMLVYLTYIDTKYYQQAIKALNSTAVLAPTDAKTFYLLAKFYDASSDKINTEKNFLKAIELKSNYDYAYFDLAKFYFDQKKYNLAKKYFELNLKYAPTNPDTKDYLAKIATASIQPLPSIRKSSTSP